MHTKKLSVILLLIILLVIPLAYAEECGITNLASCIPEKIYQYTLSMI